MKSMARECCWWPGQCKDLENLVKGCEPCLLTRASPPKQELTTWNRSDEVWSRLHIDFFGPFMNRWCLVVVDSTSKWVECVDMAKNTTSGAVITVLREMFARFGLPRMVVSDNGTAFVSQQFRQFLSLNGIDHRTTPVGNPSTNGQAENIVKTVKTALKRNLHNIPSSEFNNTLSRFLLDYRNTVHSSTGVAPSFLMFNKRSLRTRLDLVNPRRQIKKVNTEIIKNNVKRQQDNQRKYYKGSKNVAFGIDTPVMVKDYSVPAKISWKKAIIRKRLGKQIYLVENENNVQWKRHANQMIAINTAGDVIPSTILDPLQKLPSIGKIDEGSYDEGTTGSHVPRIKYNLRTRKPKS